MRAGIIVLALMILLAGACLETLLIPAVVTAVLLLVIAREPAKGKNKKPVTKVQPIIVKRKYEGPESIYPPEIEIVETAPPKAGWKAAGETGGKAVGTMLKRLWKELFE